MLPLFSLPPPLGNISSGIDDGTMGHCSREQAIHLLCSVPFCRRGNRTFPSEGLLQLKSSLARRIRIQHIIRRTQITHHPASSDKVLYFPESSRCGLLKETTLSHIRTIGVCRVLRVFLMARSRNCNKIKLPSSSNRRTTGRRHTFMGSEPVEGSGTVEIESVVLVREGSRSFPRTGRMATSPASAVARARLSPSSGP